MFRAVSGNLTARPHSGESSGENVAFRRAGKSGAPPSRTDFSEVPNSDQLSVNFSSRSSSDPGRRQGSGPGSQEGTFPGTSSRESGSPPPPRVPLDLTVGKFLRSEGETVSPTFSSRCCSKSQKTAQKVGGGVGVQRSAGRSASQPARSGRGPASLRARLPAGSK